jgi:hypothetical protein
MTTELRAEWSEVEREYLDEALEKTRSAENWLDEFDADALVEADERAIIKCQNAVYRLRLALEELRKEIESRFCDYCSQFIHDPLRHGEGRCSDPGDPGGLGG